MFAAVAVSILAAEAGMLPAVLLSKADQATRVQAGLGGTVLHMLLTIMLAAVAGLVGLAQRQPVFVWWLLVLYWTGLAMLAAGLVRIIRRKEQVP